ncbi:MAG: histidine kinase, partial [Mycobacteriales bacterium]
MRARPETTARALLAFAVTGLVASVGIDTYVELRTDQAGAALILGSTLVVTLVQLGTAVLGYVIVVRRDGAVRRLGFLLLALITVATISALGDVYGSLSWQYLAQPLPFARQVVWLPYALGDPASFPLTLLLILTFPDGRLPSRRWRYVVIALALYGAAYFVALAFGNTPYYFVFGRWVTVAKTFAVAPHWLLGPLEHLHQLLRGKTPRVLMPAAVLVLATKLRGTSGRQRRQVGVTLIAAALVALLGLFGTHVCGVLGFDPAPFTALCVPTTVALASLALPAGLAIAVFRYDLWSLDVVVNKALVSGALIGFVLASYVTVVVGLGILIGNRGRPNIATSLLATTLVALAFSPVRDRAQRAANRIVYGDRATPYEAMSAFARGISASLAPDDVLPRMAEAAARGVGARAARVLLHLADGGEHTAAWPEDATDWSSAYALPIVHDGEPIGELAIVKPRGEQLSGAERELLENLASQAGLALRNARLAVELQARLEQISAQARELVASRRRIIAAQDHERRRLERDIHDGAQQRLMALSIALRRAQARLGEDVLTAESILKEASAELHLAVADLRELARGIHPSILTDEGLKPAIESLADRSPVRIRLEIDDVERL